MRTYFHQCDLDADPSAMLDREKQVSTPWGSQDHGPCDKCGGGGEADFECSSCVAAAAGDPDCPACGGRVRFRGVCPTCEGGGKIDRTRRQGISVFPTLGGLLHYLRARDVDPDGCMFVELEGELSGDVDLDADSGAVLVNPSAIVRTLSAAEAEDEAYRRARAK